MYELLRDAEVLRCNRYLLLLRNDGSVGSENGLLRTLASTFHTLRKEGVELLERPIVGTATFRDELLDSVVSSTDL